jgi:hypothetical protein
MTKGTSDFAKKTFEATGRAQTSIGSQWEPHLWTNTHKPISPSVCSIHCNSKDNISMKQNTHLHNSATTFAVPGGRSHCVSLTFVCVLAHAPLRVTFLFVPHCYCVSLGSSKLQSGCLSWFSLHLIKCMSNTPDILDWLWIDFVSCVF